MTSDKIKNTVVIVVSYFYVLLFVYAAVSKLLDFENFRVQLGQSPLLSVFAGFISYFVLILELVIAVLLAIRKTRFIGLLSFFALMSMFSAYIIVILNYSSTIPCSCGGVLENMDWKEHLTFNLLLTILSAAVILTISSNKAKMLFKILLIMILSYCIVLSMYYYSENKMVHENPFIRRFIQGSAIKIAETNLNSNSKYFVGSHGNLLYLGDNLAPLHIIAYDTSLKTKKKYKIELEREDFPFSSVQVRIDPPYFFLMDGTVPLIYKGTIFDWKARLIFYDNQYYFSRAEIVDQDKIAFRAQELKTLHNILGVFTISDSLKVEFAPTLLQKQIDGFFDTDGMMHFDQKNKKFVYTYYYRNEFIVTDKNLNLIYRGNTIDTTSKAKLKIVYLEETKQRKIASPSATVNRITALSNNLLFVNSKVIGRYEPKEMWQQSSIVDIYDIENNTYLSSIYIYDVNKTKLHSMFVSGDYLYALIGQHLHKYKLSKKMFNLSKNH